jgi:hypothetical protein
MKKISVHEEARQVFLNKDPVEMAENAGGQYDSESDQLLITYLNQLCRVDRQAVITPDNSTFRLSRNETTCILQYLAMASGLPPRNTWISFLELPDGPHHFVPFQKEAMEPLAQAYGGDLATFTRLSIALGGQPLNMADQGFSLQVLPKLTLAFAVWEGDEEFPSKANILFDAVAPQYLSTASLWVLGIEVAERYTNQARINYL